MPLIPQETLDDILSRIDIVELISGYIPLKRVGRNYKACCPFHHEKTASFIVSPERQIYHCFGCGEGGNAFKFLTSYEKLDFQEAVESLAKKSGVILPRLESAHVQKTASLTSALHKVNELAEDFYHENLKSRESSVAKNYLLKRGLTDSVINNLKIGFAPDKWDALLNFLRSKGVSLSVIEKAGLAGLKDSGGYYDKFRNRIIFPIFDQKSKVIAFGARVLDDSLPKYINSAETPIYIKGKNLYGINFALEEIRRKDCVVIVEGYLDFITPFAAGFKNIVASLGTALTVEQIRLLKRYTRNVVIIYDPDEAGQMAAIRSLDLLVDEEMDVKVATLSLKLDPDAFVNKFGVIRFEETVGSALSLFDYKLGYLRALYGTDTPEAKAKIVQYMLETINRFKNAVLKSSYIKKLADELDLPEQDLMQESKKIKITRFQEPQSKYVPFCMSICPTEKLLVRMMLEDSSVIESLQGVLNPSDFQDAYVSRIVSAIFELFMQGIDVNANKLINHLSDENMNQIVCELSTLPVFEVSDQKKVLDDCVKRLHKDRLKSRCDQLQKEIKALQSSSDNERLNELMHEFQHLTREAKTR